MLVRSIVITGMVIAGIAVTAKSGDPPGPSLGCYKTETTTCCYLWFIEFDHGESILDCGDWVCRPRIILEESMDFAFVDTVGKTGLTELDYGPACKYYAIVHCGPDENNPCIWDDDITFVECQESQASGESCG